MWGVLPHALSSPQLLMVSQPVSRGKAKVAKTPICEQIKQIDDLQIEPGSSGRSKQMLYLLYRLPKDAAPSSLVIWELEPGVAAALPSPFPAYRR